MSLNSLLNSFVFVAKATEGGESSILAKTVIDEINKMEQAEKARVATTNNNNISYAQSFEAQLILLHRDIQNTKDLSHKFSLKRDLHASMQGLYNLKDNADILQTLDTTAVKLENIYQDATTLINHIFWENYKRFSNQLIDLEKQVNLQTLKDKVLNAKEEEIVDLLQDKIFFECYTEEEIKKYGRTISLVLYPDRVPQECKTVATTVFTIMKNLQILLIARMNACYSSEELKIQDFIENATTQYSLALRYKDAIKMKNKEITSSKYLSDMDKAKDEILRCSITELTEHKLKHALRCCSFYRSAIRASDLLSEQHNALRKQNKPNDFFTLAEKRISLRKSIAIAFLLAGHKIEAQLYIVSAIRLAADVLPNPKKTVVDLQAILDRIITPPGAANNSAPASSPNAHSSSSTDLVVLNNFAVSTPREIEAFKQKVNEYTDNMLVKHTVRADTSIVQYETPHEHIIQAKKQASLYTNGGLVVAATGGVMSLGGVAAAITVFAGTQGASVGAFATIAAMVTAGGVVGGVALTIGIIASVFGGYWLIRTGAAMHIEPEIQSKLNEITKAAVDHYSRSNFEEMFVVLNNEYATNKRLLTFEKGKIVEIPEKGNEIVKVLLSHGFRCDGVALLLHMIAEGLISGNLTVAEDVDEGTLREMALDIIKTINENKELDNNAKELDRIVFESKSKLFKQTSQSVARSLKGIPASYFQDAEIAPFVARLEEIKNMSLINRIIINVLKNSEKSKQFAITTFERIRDSITKNFQYFSICIHRMDALEDFLFALGLSVPEPAPINAPTAGSTTNWSNLLMIGNSAVANSSSKTNISTSYSLQWGNQKLCCTELITSSSIDTNTNTLYFHEILSAMIPNRVFYSDQEVNYYLIKASNEAYQRNETDQQGNIVESIEYQALQALQTAFAKFLKNEEIKPITKLFLESQLHNIKNGLNCEIVFFRKGSKKAISAQEEEIICTLIDQTITHVTSTSTSSATNIELYALSDDMKTLVCVHREDSTAQNSSPAAGLAFGAAVYLGQARKFVQEGRWKQSKSNLLESVSCYHYAAQYYQKALEIFSFTWKQFFYLPTKNLAQFREYHLFTRTAAQFLPARVYLQEEIDCILGLMECFTKMFQFDRVLGLVSVFLNKEELTAHFQFWYWYSIAARKSISTANASNYFDAIFAIQRAFACPDSAIACKEFHGERELRIIKKLREANISNERTALEYLDSTSTDNRMYDDSYMTRMSRKPYYDILAVDGGGIKGIIPALWVAEIEKRAKRPAAQLFNMIAGTSTGSIIAAALSVPSPYTGMPIAAHELSKLYCKPSSLQNVFCASSFLSFGGIWESRYNNNRLHVIQEYVHETTLSASLTDLLVVAVDEHFPDVPHVFSTRKVREQTSFDVKIYEAVMASSAAPTYFPAYKIDGRSYIDGGMQANNPAELAFDEAMHHHTPENIRIWSLGTGDCVKAYNGASNRGALFWAQNAYDVAVRAQQGQVDKRLSDRLGDRYHRWQAWMPDEIKLDAYDESTLCDLIHQARQFIEEADCSDANPINRCVEQLLEKY